MLSVEATDFMHTLCGTISPKITIPNEAIRNATIPGSRSPNRMEMAALTTT